MPGVLLTELAAMLVGIAFAISLKKTAVVFTPMFADDKVRFRHPVKNPRFIKCVWKLIL